MVQTTGLVCCPDGIRGFGNIEPGIMIIGQFPNTTEMETGLPFTGPDGQLLDAVLKATGWSREDVYCTNSCCVRDLLRAPICRPRLLREIDEYKPRLVVTLGAFACENLFGEKISRRRGFLLREEAGYIAMSTWLPSAILQADTPEQQNDFAAEFVRDIRKIARYFAPGKSYPEPVTRPFCFVNTVEAAQELLDELPRDKLVTLDIETPIIDKDDKASDPFAQILCVGIGLEDDYQYVFPEEILGKLTFPKDVMWGGWNLYGFDLVGLRAKYGVEIPVVHDGMLTSYVLDERTKYGTHKLKHNAREDAGAPFWEEDNTRLDSVALHKYNGLDCAYNHRVLQSHLSRFDDDDRHLYYDLLMPAANMYAEAQYYGVSIDVWKTFEMTMRLQVGADALMEELTEMAYEIGWSRFDPFNPNSDQQTARLLFDMIGINPATVSHRTKSGERWSVDKNVLDLINHPYAAKLRLHRQLTDTKSRYIDNVQSQIKFDFKVHPKCWIPGTTTGRPSYSDPPVQQLPHRRTIGDLAEVRAIFTVDSPDYIMLAADYSQGELWMLYGFSGDKNLLADLTEPWSFTGNPDYHSRTCSMGIPCTIHGQICAECGLHREMCACLHFKMSHGDNCPTCVKWEFDRDNQKHVNFGIPYGESAYGLMRPPPIGTGLSLKECQDLIMAWYKRNNDVLQWQKDIEYILRTKGFIKTPSGRKRRFPIVLSPKQIRQAINSPIQGTLSDYTLSSAIAITRRIKHLRSRLLWTTHDEILLHVHRDHLDEVRSIVLEEMTQPRYVGFPAIPVEIKLGNNLWEISP